MRIITLFMSILIFPLTVLADVNGPARIVNGDTIRIGETEIRLHGIDAPEMKQECQDANGNTWIAGQDATAFLKSLTEGKQVSCSEHGKDSDGRIIGSCYAGVVNLNAEMVKAGWAMSYQKYSQRYVYEEIFAQKAKAGMWGGKCEPPWEWRKKQ